MANSDTKSQEVDAPSSRRPEYLGDPTIGRVMLRVRWLLALLLAIAVAGIFAWLGRWQLESAIEGATTVIETETVRPLVEVAEPGAPPSEVAAGAVVEISGSFAPGDFTTVAPRVNGDETGVWVVAHLLTPEPEASHLIVALGWAPDLESAEQSISQLRTADDLTESHELEGRYMPGESAIIPHADEDPLAMQSMVPGHVINTWESIDSPVYSGYLVLHPDGAEELLDSAGLSAIDSVPPETNSAVNLLNAFYAIEWAVFAAAAIFMWYRLVRDAWEKEHERKLLEAGADPNAL